jgi:hypothetical protein
VQRIDGACVMRHQSLACAWGAQREIGTAPSRSHAVLQHAPEAFNGIEVGPTMGREKMAPSLAIVVVKSCIECVGPRDPAALHDHHDVWAGFAAGGHDVMQILPSCLGLTVRHDFLEALGGPILDGATDAAPDAAGDAPPRARPHPRVACKSLIAFDLPVAQRACREARARRCAPPARAE